jgi:hypothetical protein
MALPRVIAQPFFRLPEALRFRLATGEQSPMRILRSHQPGTSNNDAITIFVRLQNESGTNTESLSNLRRDRNLPLRGQL